MRKAAVILLLLSLLLGACSAQAEDDNGITIKEIATLELPGGARYNDVYGYSNPETGTYLVFFGNRDTLAIVDVADPANPKVLSTVALPFSPSSHHDMMTYGEYLFVVSEHSSAFSEKTPEGLMVVDFSDPSRPSVTVHDEAFHSAHTIYIDEATGTLYASGTERGMVIVDITNPGAPAALGTLSDPYVHEVYVEAGIAYTSEIQNGTLGVYDVSNPASIRLIDRIRTPGAATHSTWLSRDDSVIITADETHTIDYEQQRVIREEGGVAFYANPAAYPARELELIGELVLPDATVHQIHVRGQYLVASWYTEGVVIADISDPEHPQIVETYDTSRLDRDDASFGGAWGVWPYDPRGTYLYVSDMERGLVILEITGLVLP